jgi:hypothetical protein
MKMYEGVEVYGAERSASCPSRQLGSPQSRSGHSDEEKRPFPIPGGNETPVVQPVVSSPYWLIYVSVKSMKTS